MDVDMSAKPSRGHADLAFHAQRLHRQGFSVVGEVLDEGDLEYLHGIMDGIYAAYDPERDSLRKVKGYHFSANLVDKDPFFETLFLRPPIYDLARFLLGEECILSSLNSFEPLPGQGNQGLHRDGKLSSSQHLGSINTLWALDDIDRDNGATRVIPGSHKTDEKPPFDESGTVHVKVKAGSVIVTNTHILHAASANHSGRRRRLLHGYFTEAGHAQQTDQKKHLSAEVKARLSLRARQVLALP